MLGVKKLHVFRLLANGKLSRAPGGVDAPSVERYRADMRPPSHFVSSREAALRLGISPRHITRLVRERVLEGMILPQSLGGTFVDPVRLKGVDPIELANHGVQVGPPPGYVTSRAACKILDRGRSSLQALVMQGRIERISKPGMNDWYLEADVKAVAENRR